MVLGSWTCDSKGRGFESQPFRFPVTNRGQVVYTHTCASVTVCIVQYNSVGTGQGAVMPCGWGGNRRSAIELAMRHRLQWFIHLQVHRLRQGDEHPAYIPHRVRYTLPYHPTDRNEWRQRVARCVPHNAGRTDVYSQEKSF